MALCITVIDETDQLINFMNFFFPDIIVGRNIKWSLVLPHQGEGSCKGCSNTNSTCLRPPWDILPKRGIKREKAA